MIPWRRPRCPCTFEQFIPIPGHEQLDITLTPRWTYPVLCQGYFAHQPVLASHRRPEHSGRARFLDFDGTATDRPALASPAVISWPASPVASIASGSPQVQPVSSLSQAVVAKHLAWDGALLPFSWSADLLAVAASDRYAGRGYGRYVMVQDRQLWLWTPKSDVVPREPRMVVLGRCEVSDHCLGGPCLVAYVHPLLLVAKWC